MFATILGIAAGVISLLAFVPYTHSILRASSQPRLSTWIIWSTEGFVLAWLSIHAGADAAQWQPISYVIGPLTVVIVLIWQKRVGMVWERLDSLCIAIALISVWYWRTFDQPVIALGCNLAIDLAGAIPTLVSVWHDPKAENRLAWRMFFAGSVCNVAAITIQADWSLYVAAYPLYLLTGSGSMNLLLLRQMKKPRH